MTVDEMASSLDRTSFSVRRYLDSLEPSSADAPGGSDSLRQQIRRDLRRKPFYKSLKDQFLRERNCRIFHDVGGLYGAIWA